MRATLICFTIVGVVLGSAVPVQAEEMIYLPLIANGEKPPHFQIISARLWSSTENGRSPGSPDLCGERHVLQVHVFNECGDCGEASRLHGASVLVTHHTRDGSQTNETQQTGSEGSEVGIAQFDLQRSAQIWIVAQLDFLSPSSSIWK